MTAWKSARGDRRSVAGAAVLMMCASITLSGCAQSRYTYLSPANPRLMTESGTARLEVADRIARFRRLAAMQGTIPPEVEQFAAPRGSAPGVDQPVPVVRVVFDERVFFDFDGDAPRPEAMTVLEQIAESMKRDAPDAAITVLGHTDAVGTDAYNIDLSRRRAASVVRLLILRGVSPHQLSTVAIGKSQPVAPTTRRPAGGATGAWSSWSIPANRPISR
jgi:outer membrane protein OmpA-like peptidoglycan-associated protein